jgi:Zn-dependent protease with chaperone function
MSAALVLQALGWALLHSLWQLALVGGIAGGLLRMAGPERPGAQYRIALAALLVCLILPAATLVLQLLQPLAGPVALGPTLAVAPIPGLGSAAPLAPIPWGTRMHALCAARVAWIAAGWALGVLVFGTRMAGGWWTTQGWRQSAQVAPPEWEMRLAALAATLGVCAQVRLRASARVASPVVLGLWRPLVLVPLALFSAMPAPCLEALLAHELAHVRRHDYLVNLLQSLVEVLCFHHPVVWWLSARARAVREQLCDDLAISALGEPRMLALALDRLDDLQPQFPTMAMAARGGTLLHRIERLLKRPAPARTPWNSGLALLLALPLAALVLHAAVPAAPAIPGRPAAIAELDALAVGEGLDPDLLRALAWTESGLRATATSPSGAIGLLQVTPATARAFGAVDLADRAQVDAAGARYLRSLLDRYPGDLGKAVAAYNAGPEAVDAGRLSAEAVSYRQLVLDLVKARAVQPAPELGPGQVDGVLRVAADGETWTLEARISTRGELRLAVLPDPAEPAEPAARPYGLVKAGGSGVPAGWVVSQPRVILKVPRGAPFLVRASDPSQGIAGQVRIEPGLAYKAFAFTMVSAAR